MTDQRWSDWEKLNKIEAQEWEHLAFEKCDKLGQVFLAHYFEPHMCLVCFGVHMFSMLRTRQDFKDGQADIITRKWCTGCGHFHMPVRIAVGAKRYYRQLNRR